MKRLVTILVIIALAPQLSAGWFKIYGIKGGWEYSERAYGVLETPDGGFAVLGGTGNPDTGIWFLRTDSLGDTIRTRNFAIGFCTGYCIKEVKEGGYIIAGEADFKQLLLMRTNSEGDTLWTKQYGDQKYDEGYWVCTTSDGGYAATGYVGEWPDSPRRLWLLRTDSEGDTLWTRQYGGELGDWGTCVEQTPDGGFIITGTTKTLNQYGGTDVWLLKTDSLGDTLWTRTFGAENDDGGDQVIATRDGGYVIVGIYDLTGSMVPESGDVLLIKTDSLGNVEWQKTYGISGGTFIEMAYSVEQTADGGYIVVGTREGFTQTKTDIWLLKTDSLGDTLWTRTFAWPGIDEAWNVHQTQDGGYVIAGATWIQSEEGSDRDLLLIKTDSLGLLDIEESPVTHLSDFEIVNSVIPVGGNVVLRYENYPQGFKASIYDATGRKVDSIESRASSGSISWGMGYSPGVYIIREEGETRAKVVLVK